MNGKYEFFASIWSMNSRTFAGLAKVLMFWFTIICRKINPEVLNSSDLCQKIQFFCPSNRKKYVEIISVRNNLCPQGTAVKNHCKPFRIAKTQTHVTQLQYN